MPAHVDVDGVLLVGGNLDPLRLPRRPPAAAAASLALHLDAPPGDALQGQRDSQDGVPFDRLEYFQNTFKVISLYIRLLDKQSLVYYGV